MTTKSFTASLERDGRILLKVANDAIHEIVRQDQITGMNLISVLHNTDTLMQCVCKLEFKKDITEIRFVPLCIPKQCMDDKKQILVETVAEFLDQQARAFRWTS